VIDFYKNSFTIYIMKTAEELRKAIDKAKQRDLTPVYNAVNKAIAELERQMDDLVLNPNLYSNNPVLGSEMPAGAYYNGSYANFLTVMRLKLNPLGYDVKESHDGGGMHSTYTVRMKEAFTKNTCRDAVLENIKKHGR
jgi:hypothetical protein